MFGQPRLELVIGLHFFLQGLEGFQTSRQIGLFGLLGIHRLLGGASRLIQLRHLRLQLFQLRAGHFGAQLGLLQLLFQVVQAHFIGRGQGIAVGAQALMTRRQRTALLFDVALIGGQHLNLLLHLRHTAALLVAALLGHP